MKNSLLAFAMTIIVLLSANAQTKNFAAGFKVIHATDSSRVYQPNTDVNNVLHFRPLDIDFWYPAQVSSSDPALVYGDILGLLEQRANYYTGTTNSAGLTMQIAKAFCDGFKCSDSSKLLAYRTKTYKNANVQKGKWPLVIYLASYGSLCYENFMMLEALAEKGYVVISISSIGRFPGDMTTAKEDLFEQIADAVFSVKHFAGNPSIDFSKIAVIGYSWGGLAGNLLPNKFPNIKCIVSLEGSEFHHYGQKDPDAKKDDSNFNDLIKTPEFSNRNMQVPYLRFESSPSDSKNEFDSVYQFATALHDKKIFQILNAQHEDFSCIGPVVKSSGNCVVDNKYTTVLKLTLSYIDEKIRKQGSFNKEIAKFLNKSIVENK